MGPQSAAVPSYVQPWIDPRRRDALSIEGCVTSDEAAPMVLQCGVLASRNRP